MLIIEDDSGGILFSSGALDAMGRPETVKPLLDMENKVFALQVSKSTLAQSIKGKSRIIESV